MVRWPNCPRALTLKPVPIICANSGAWVHRSCRLPRRHWRWPLSSGRASGWRDVGRHPRAVGNIADRVQALNEIVLLKYGYTGDELTYDDLQNANMIRVVDRRKGLPVALGVLYIHAARAQGWEAYGLNFPGHFLVRVSEGAERAIVDPFHNGTVCDAAGLRDLLKATAGQDVGLSPDHYAPVADRDVLLRLQNNLKSRLLQAADHARALRVVETMLMLAPDLP